MIAEKATHNDFAYDIKVSNDNTKGERRATIHVRTDEMDPHEAVELALKMYKECLI